MVTLNEFIVVPKIQTPGKDIPYCLPKVTQGIFSTSTGFLTMFILKYFKLQLLYNNG